MIYIDLRNFIEKIKEKGNVRIINNLISSNLEITEICDRVLQFGGPAIFFKNIKHKKFLNSICVISNLFGTPERIAWSINLNNVSSLRKLGFLLSLTKNNRTSKNFKDIMYKIYIFKKAISETKYEIVDNAFCQEIIIKEKNVNINVLPTQYCWPKDISYLLTWGLVITYNNKCNRYNLGIYRQQPISNNKLIIRWLKHRGGFLDFREHCIHSSNKPFPICIAFGSDPATIISSIIPLPESLSEYNFSGLLRGDKIKLVKSITNNMLVPANSEVILEGYIFPYENVNKKIYDHRKFQKKYINKNYESELEGPYGDHTGYYNEQSNSPIFTIKCITMRFNTLYHSTYTGKPPDEVSIIGIAMNEIFLPLLNNQITEIQDFYLPPEGCSYRLAIISINKQYIGHGRRIMLGIWSILKQFIYIKFIIIVDREINIRNWKDIIWSITTKVDPSRDVLIIKKTSIDYLDFASSVSGLSGKMGIDATNKWFGETNRKWGKCINMNQITKFKIDKIWKNLKI